MASKLVSLIFGIVLGVGAAWLVLRQPAPHVEQDATSPPQTIAAEGAGNSELEAARKRIDKLEATNLELADRVQSLLRQTTTQGAARSKTSPSPDSLEVSDGAEHLLSLLTGGSDTDPSRRAAVKEMMASVFRKQVDSKLARLQERLILTPEQAQEAREILESHYSSGLSLAAQIMTDDPEEELTTMLTPEQQTSYTELQREDRRNAARRMAKSELLQIQEFLGLSEAQQDRAFQILAEQAEQQVAGESGSRSSLNFRAEYTRKLEAMKQVLTSEQYGRYAKLQEEQLKIIESVIPKD